MSKIATIIVTYNRKELLLKSVDSVLQQTLGLPDVVVIDNASTDGTRMAIEEISSNNARVKYYNTGANLGGAGGFSYGINLAVNLGYEYLWIMDDDTIPENNALEELMKAADLLDNSFGFLSSYVKWTDGSSCIMNIPQISPQWRFFDIEKQFDNKMIMLESSSFVSMFVRADVVREVGLPIKEFFIWADDVEFSLRLSAKYKSFYVLDSQVVHAIKNNTATSIIKENDESRLNRYYYLYRNRYYIARKLSKRAKLAFWIGIADTIRDIIRSSSDNKFKKCCIVIRSSIRGLFFHPKIESVHSIKE